MQRKIRKQTRVAFILLANLVGLLAAFGVILRSGEREPLRVKINQTACGALLRDDFNSGTINECLWRPWLEDPGVRVGIENRALCVRGTSAKIPEEVLRKAETKLWRFSGLVSRQFPQIDVALAVRVRYASGIPEEPGLHGITVHLCGVIPDTSAEVLFGKVDGNATQEIMHDFARAGPDDIPYPDARGWFLGIWSQRGEHNHYLISGRPLPSQGDEQKTFQEVLVDHDEQTYLSRAFVKLGERWVQLGKAEPLFRSLSQVELKLQDITPLHGAYREAYFDDCRLYPNPRHHPVRLVAVTGRHQMQYHGPRLRVAIYTSDEAHKVSEGYTDQYGMTRLPVDTPLWVTFPVSAMIRVFQGQKEVATSVIEAHGVNGLYPGDVWAFDASHIH